MSAIKWHRQYHAMLAAPLGVADLMLGHLAFILLRSLLVSVAFVLVAAALGAFTSWWVLLAVPVAVLCAGAHAAVTMAYAARQENESGFNLVYRFTVIPMFLFAGTFFPIGQLPEVIRWVAMATPLWHATELSRQLSLGGMTVASAVGHLSYLCLWLVVGSWLALTGLQRRLVE